MPKARWPDARSPGLLPRRGPDALRQGIAVGIYELGHHLGYLIE